MLTSGTEFSIEQLKINLVGGPHQSYNFPECKTFLILIRTVHPSSPALPYIVFFSFSTAFSCLLATWQYLPRHPQLLFVEFLN